MDIYNFLLDKEDKEKEKQKIGSSFGGGWGLSDLVKEQKEKENNVYDFLLPKVTADIKAGAGASAQANVDLDKSLQAQKLKEKFTSTDDVSYWGGTSQDPTRLANTPFGGLAKTIGTQRAVEKIYPEETKALKDFRSDIYIQADKKAKQEGKDGITNYDLITTIQERLTGKAVDKIQKENSLTTFAAKNPEFKEAVNLYHAIENVDSPNAVLDAMETITWSGMFAILGGQGISLLYNTAPKVMDAIKTKTNVATPEQFREIMSKATGVNSDPKAAKAFKEITAELNKVGLKPIDVIRGKMNVTYTTPRFAMEGGKLYAGLPADEIAKAIIETGKVTADVAKGLNPVEVSKVTQQLLNTAPALASEFLKAVEKPETSITEMPKEVDRPEISPSEPFTAKPPKTEPKAVDIKIPQELEPIAKVAQKTKSVDEFIEKLKEPVRPIREAMPGELVIIQSDTYGKKTAEDFNIGIPTQGEILKVNPKTVSVKVGENVYKYPDTAKVSELDLKGLKGYEKEDIEKLYNQAKTPPKPPEITIPEKEVVAPKPTTSQSSETPRTIPQKPDIAVPQQEQVEPVKPQEQALPEAKTEPKAPDYQQPATNEQKQEIHVLAKQKKLITETKSGNISTDRYKRIAKAMTGKTSTKDMTVGEAEEFKAAIEGVVQRQPWEPPIIPISTKIVNKEFFEDIDFKKPTLFKKITPKEHVLRAIGAEDLVKPLTEAKKESYLRGIDVNNFIDNTVREINKKAPVIEKIKGKLFNQPTKRLANFRDLLDRYEIPPDYLSDKDKEIFTKLRKFTNEMLKDVNVVRERLGLDKIEKLNAYVPHFLDELSRQIVEKKYPFPEDVKYWIGRNMPKKIHNPTEMQRRVKEELTDVFSKDLGKLLKIMARYDLRDIYLSEPYSILRARLNALGDKIPVEVRKEIDDYVRYDIFEYPDELDTLFNNTVETPVQLINFFLKPVGRVITNPAKSVSQITRRLLMLGAIGGRPKLVLRNLNQRLLIMDLYQPKYFLKAQLVPVSKGIQDIINNSNFWKLSSKQGFEDVPKEGISAEKLLFAPYGWSHKSNVNIAMKAGALFAQDMINLSNDPNSAFYKYAQRVAVKKGVPIEKLLWTFDDIEAEATDAASYTQWLYYSTGMPQIYRGHLKRAGFSLQSWVMNYFTKHFMEMKTRTFTGRTSRGKLLRPIDRLNALKGLAIITGICWATKKLFNFAYEKYLLPIGILFHGNILSPSLQTISGIGKYILAKNDWERNQAEWQIKSAWKLFIPGSLLYQDTIDWINGKKSLAETLFYMEYRKKDPTGVFDLYDMTSKGISGGANVYDFLTGKDTSKTKSESSVYNFLLK